MSVPTLTPTSTTTVDQAVFAALSAAVAPLGFASRDDVDSVAARLRQRIGTHTGAGVHGQRFFLRVSPGTVGLRAITSRPMELADPDQASDPAAVAVGADTLREGLLEELVLFDLEEPGRQITEWSRRSRARMVERIAELDLSAWSQTPGVFGLLTLTVAGPWQAIAPDGRTFKRLVDKLRKRVIDARDEDGRPLQWVCLWKMEFQHRGAPHMHLLMKIPGLVNGERFENWISQQWAEVVRNSLPLVSDVDLLGYPVEFGYDEPATQRGYVRAGHFRKHLAKGTDVSFSGVKWDDPRRTAIYFLKHSSKTRSKEYQNVVPAAWLDNGGAGRFWGYSGLQRAVAEVEVDRATFHAARRVLRHVARARNARTEMSRLRAAGDAGDPWSPANVAARAAVFSMRRPRRRGGFGAAGGGWVLVNDGVGLAWDVGKHLAALQE